MNEGFCYGAPEPDREFRHHVASQGFETYRGVCLNLYAVKGGGRDLWFCTVDDPETAVSGIRIPGDHDDGHEAVAQGKRYIDEHIQWIQRDLAELVRRKKATDQEQAS